MVVVLALYIVRRDLLNLLFSANDPFFRTRKTGWAVTTADLN